jgi:PAS domain S-box-containing protein
MSNLEPKIDNYIISPLFLLLLIGGLIGVVTFFFLLRFRKTPGVKYWLIWQIAAALWAFTYAFEFAATDLETKIMWSKFSYFGIVYGPVSFLLFSLALSSKFKYLQKKYVILIFAFASLFILSPFTNDYHHLHWKSYGIDPETNATNYVYGPLFWIMTIFAYVALIWGIINISLLYFRLSGYYKRQITLLFIASLLPLCGNIIYVFHINPLSGFDWTPFSFLLTGILIAINISQFKMFDLVPFARNKLFEIIPDAIMIVDGSKRIADYNPAMKKLIGLEDKDLTGRSIDAIFPMWRKMIKQIGEMPAFQTIVSHEVSGKMCYFDLQSSSLHDQHEQGNGRLVILKDISTRIMADEKITESHIRLINEIQEKEQLIYDLDSFSHTVAHDLKGMLGAIVSASHLIKLGFDDMSKEELLEINELIGQSAIKTMHITAELLTLASVRQEDIKRSPVDMQKVVIDSVNRLEVLIREKNANIMLPEVWPEVIGYEAWLEEVWINYISNAIKYGGTPPTIQIGSDILSDDRVKFWVMDNGKGLSQDEMVQLFNKFTRLDTMRAEGHGLGLSIVKRIVEKLNGEVGVESQNIQGEGSVFYFILPKANDKEVQRKAAHG